MAEKKRGLGRGLDALLGPIVKPEDLSVEQVNTDGELKKLSIELIRPGKYQPRKDMSEGLLEELAQSIRSHGVIQPIVVRKLTEGRYEIIAGERRWRASQRAGLTEVPVVIRDVSDLAASAMALIENIQREDLNVMEEARALHKLLEEFGMTHQAVAEAVGKSRATVSNTLRLMTLDEGVKKLLENSDLDMGHARAILALPQEQQLEVADLVVARSLSVRETEQLVKRWNAPHATKAEQAETFVTNPDVKRLENRLSDTLGAVVNIKHKSTGKGTLIIHYNSLDELDGVIEKIH